MQVPKRGAKIIEPRDFWIPHNSLKKTTSDSAVSNYLRAPIATALVPGMVNRHPSCWMWLHRTRDGIHRTKLNPWMVEKVKTNQFKIILTQGLNRQIRRMCDYFDYKVVALQRIRIMNIKLDIPEGKYRLLTDSEIKLLRK